VPRVTPAALAATVFLAVFAGALAYWLWSYGLARVEAARATNYLNLLPLVAVLSGTLVLGEAHRCDRSGWRTTHRRRRDARRSLARPRRRLAERQVSFWGTALA
jgi:hypothetical protein